MTGTAVGSSNAMVAHPVYGNGRVVYVGDSSPVDDGNRDPGNTVYGGWTELAGAKADDLLNAAQWATRRASCSPATRRLRRHGRHERGETPEGRLRARDHVDGDRRRSASYWWTSNLLDRRRQLRARSRRASRTSAPQLDHCRTCRA